jgi:hypothetical protein
MVEQFADSQVVKVAMLIDGDNAQPSLIGGILTETAKYGAITIRRVYGDWTTANMAGWKNVLNNYAIQPIQQFRYTVGKNSTDSAMIIDAMDLLHGHLVTGFCLVSSDSDYTRLATRIREAGVFVMGIGKKTTPKAFVNACNIFIFTENLSPRQAVRRGRGEAKAAPQREEKPKEKELDPLPLLRGAFEMAVQEDGWANLGTLGFYLHQLDPSFDPRTYGFKQLSQLIKSHSNFFELKFRDEGGTTNVYMKSKE